MMLYLLLFENKQSIKERLSKAGKSMEEVKFSEKRKQSNFLIGLLRNSIQNLEKSNYYSNIKSKLLQAYIKMKPIEFIEISIIVGLVVGTVFFQLANNIWLVILGFVVGYKVPEIFIEAIRKKRAKQLNSQLPQALSLLSNGLRAGFSFPQAMAVVSREMEAPIAEEFSKVLRDNSYGKNMNEALEDLAKRTDDEDLDIFITTLLIQMQVGGDLSEILDTISGTIRERVKLKGDVHTLTSQSRMSAVIIGIMPIAIAGAIFMLNPEYIGTLFSDPLGLMMLGTAAVMMMIGIVALVKIVQVKI
jgi:tight adherence protein B